jgi:hypothetical protein
MTRPGYTYLSFGGGTQSSALLVMATLQLRGVGRPDLVVFADTQSEPPWVYDHVEAVRRWCEPHGLAITVRSRGDLGADVAARATGAPKRIASVPLWVRGEDGRATPGRRQCTREYKIEVCEKAVREALGYAKGQRVRHAVTALIGISHDERQRVRVSRTPWVTNSYPLVELMVSVEGCRDLLRRVGLPVPRKSACYFCPYHGDGYWLDLRDRDPAQFERACAFDEAVRDQSSSGMRNPTYVHRSLTPLRVAELDGSRDQKHLPGAGLFDDFANECEGMCGV